MQCVIKFREYRKITTFLYKFEMAQKIRKSTQIFIKKCLKFCLLKLRWFVTLNSVVSFLLLVKHCIRGQINRCFPNFIFLKIWRKAYENKSHYYNFRLSEDSRYFEVFDYLTSHTDKILVRFWNGIYISKSFREKN